MRILKMKLILMINLEIIQLKDYQEKVSLQ